MTTPQVAEHAATRNRPLYSMAKYTQTCLGGELRLAIGGD